MCFIKKKHAKLTQNKSTKKGPRELPTECETSARGGGADETTGGQEGGRPRGEEVKDFCEILHFYLFFYCRQFCYFDIFLSTITSHLKFPSRGRLRRALAGLGVVDGGVDEKDDKEGETPLLKETECPVCLQVCQYRKTVKRRNSKMKMKLSGNGNDSS